MYFEWDEAKSSACFLERGFDFAFAAFAFADPDRIIRQDNRYRYDEDRYQLVGRIGKRLFVLVYIRVMMSSGSFPPEKPMHAR